MPGTKLWSSARPVHAVNHWVPSSVLAIFFPSVSSYPCGSQDVLVISCREDCPIPTWETTEEQKHLHQQVAMLIGLKLKITPEKPTSSVQRN